MNLRKKILGLGERLRLTKTYSNKNKILNKELNPYTKSFLLLAATTFSILLTAAGVSLAYEKILKPEKSLPPNAFIGNVEVGELKISEAVQKINQHIEDWRTLALIDLYFFDEKVLIASDQLRFDAESIVLQAKEEGYANFSPTLSLAAIEEAVKQFTYVQASSSVNYQSLKVEIEEQLKVLNTDTVSIDINEYIEGSAKVETTVVAQAQINTADAKGYIANWVTALDGLQVESNQVFSLLQSLENNGQYLTKGEELNAIATGVYQVFMQTNFQIVERHISRTPPSYAKLGYDAIAVPNSADLKFYNPNFYDYELRAAYENNTITISLHGKAFLYKYEILSEEEEVIKPRTIVQFSTKRIIGDVQTIRNGRNGYLISVYQTIWGENGEFISKVKISEDFYPPIHRIEERSLYVEPIQEEEFEWFDPEFEFPEWDTNQDTVPEIIPESNTQSNSVEFSQPESTLPFEVESEQ